MDDTLLTAKEAAEGLLRYYTGGKLNAGPVDALAEDIKNLLVEKYGVSSGRI